MVAKKSRKGVNPKDLIGSAKVPLHLLPPVAKVHGALAMVDGDIKYGAYNWRDYPVLMTIYMDAIERHLDCLKDGEDDAPDSGVSHLGHIIACAAIILDAAEAGCLDDDRPTLTKTRGIGNATTAQATAREFLEEKAAK